MVVQLDLGTSCTKTYPCESFDPEQPEQPTDICEITVRGIQKDIHQLLAVGYNQLWYKENETAASQTLAPVAKLPVKGTDKLDGICRQDVYLARLVTPYQTSKSNQIEEKHIEENQLLVYPNPAQNRFTVELPLGDYTMSIYSSLGQQIHQQSITGTTSIESTTWQSGIYFIQVQAADESESWLEKVWIE